MELFNFLPKIVPVVFVFSNFTFLKLVFEIVTHEKFELVSRDPFKLTLFNDELEKSDRYKFVEVISESENLVWFKFVRFINEL
jgi:hypothetical protein